MEIIREFGAINKHDAGLAGGKGASLGEMTGAGIPVPPGFVLLAGAFEKFLAETDLNVEIDTVLHTVNHEEIHTVDSASEKIQALILAAKMPKDIETEIKKHFKKLGAKFVAVRSSATSEDSASAAWAGQLDSFLNTTDKTLIENVKRCWASLFTPRAIFYRFELFDKMSNRGQILTNTQTHADMMKISVAVVIQKMVESEISGIAFSVHPVTEDRNQLIIEAGLGLGEAIVSGQITPDSYVVEKTPRRIIDVNVSEQTRGLFRKPGGGNVWKDIPSVTGASQKLSEKQIFEFSELILKIEQHYGFPCDIEWAFETCPNAEGGRAGKFYIVQSRPITTLKAVSSESKNETKKTEVLWSKNYSIEDGTYQLAFPMVVFGISEMQKVLLGKNHPYVLTEHFVHYKGINLEGGYYKDADLKKFAETINTLIYTEPKRIFKNHKEAYAINDRYLAFSKLCLKKKLPKLSNKQLADLYFKLTTLQEKAHLWALATTWFVDSHGAVFATELLEKTKEIVATAHSKRNPADVFSLLTTPPKNSFGIEEEIESLAIISKITKNKKTREIFKNLREYEKIPAGISPALEREMEAHRKKWCWMPFGYHGPAYGIDYYLSVWAGLVREGIDTKKLIAEKKNRPRAIAREREALFKELKITSGMKKVYDIGADITFLKGYRKDTCYYGFYAVNSFFKEFEKRLKIPIENFHILTYFEICDLLKGKIKYNAEEIEKRKQSAIQYWDGNTFSLFSGQDAVEFFNSKSIKKEIVDFGGDTFKGVCACSGYAKGIVKIVNKPEEMSKMNQGDIMISHTTFPSLVPAMKKAAAIVTEDGGITCHAAIVARELKTPCITGIKIITQVVKDGDEIEVNADNGTVKIISKNTETVSAEPVADINIPIPFEGKDEWMLAENIPDMDMFFAQIFLSCFVNDTSYSFIKKYSETLSYYKKGFGMDFYFGKRDSFEVAESILKAVIEKPDFGDEVNKNIVLWSKKLIDFAWKVRAMDLSKKSNEELWRLFEEHDTVHTKLYTYGWLPVALDMFHNNFTDKLKEYLRSVCGSDKEIEEAFVVLCTPTKKTIIAREREDFLKIFETHSILVADSVSKKSAEIPSEIKKELEKHASEWGHLGYIYSGSADPFGPKHYFEEMIDLAKSGITPKQIIDREQKQLEDAEKKKQILYKKLKISPAYKRLFNTANDFALTKLIRRDAQLRDMFILHRGLLDEIAKRLEITRAEVQFMLQGEVRDALVDGLIDRNKIADRLAKPCILYTKKNFERVYAGEEAEILRRGIKTDIDQTQTEFRGQVAQPGFATGTVKIIIRAKDMAKMKEGDILVSIATDPDIVPAMKKAAAIVTEQGGITSHAAIVSRELGTPCIIGTKIATKLLKDGDVVEVDANKGIVKIIKKV